ncbi:MAG: hypothetical protein AAF226_10660 [Verrucomicrobiota bacterium]
MKYAFWGIAVASLTFYSTWAQGPKPTDLGASPQPIGESGIAWYTTWETGLAEAQRSGRPIFFMAAAATCSGIPGVF